MRHGTSRAPLLVVTHKSLQRFIRQVMLELALVVLAGCGSASEDTDRGAAAESTRPWSKDRFGLEVTAPGAYSNGDAYWMAVLFDAAYQSNDLIKAQLQTR